MGAQSLQDFIADGQHAGIYGRETKLLLLTKPLLLLAVARCSLLGSRFADRWLGGPATLLRLGGGKDALDHGSSFGSDLRTPRDSMLRRANLVRLQQGFDDSIDKRRVLDLLDTEAQGEATARSDERKAIADAQTSGVTECSAK